MQKSFEMDKQNNFDEKTLSVTSSDMVKQEDTLEYTISNQYSDKSNSNGTKNDEKMSLIKPKVKESLLPKFEKGTFQCTECSYKTNHSDNFRRHFQGVHQKLHNFECENCDYSSVQKHNLQRHIKSAHKML